jgi:hypothetical protein
MAEDGTIAVADAFARQILLFNSAGVELRSVGRRGSGPGEFESIEQLWPDVGGVSVYDGRLFRVTTIDLDGTVTGEVRLELTGERARPSPRGRSGPGSLIVVNDGREFIEARQYRARADILSYDSQGRVIDSLFSVPCAEMWNWVWEMGTTPATVPFGRSTFVRVHGDAIFVGTNDEFRIDRYDAGGRLTHRIGLDRQAELLTDAEVEAYKAAENAKATSGVESKGPNEIFGRIADAAPYPDRIPFYDEVLVDSDGRLWVRGYRTDPRALSHFVVFGVDGRVLALAELPGDFEPTVIRGGTIIGIWRDELDVESVRVYEVVGSDR